MEVGLPFSCAESPRYGGRLRYSTMSVAFNSCDRSEPVGSVQYDIICLLSKTPGEIVYEAA